MAKRGLETKLISKKATKSTAISKRKAQLSTVAEELMGTMDSMYKKRFMRTMDRATDYIKKNEGVMFELEVYKDYYCTHDADGYDNYKLSKKAGTGYRLEGTPRSKENKFNKLSKENFYNQMRDTIISKYMILATSKSSSRAKVDVWFRQKKGKVAVKDVVDNFEDYCTKELARRIYKMEYYIRKARAK